MSVKAKSATARGRCAPFRCRLVVMVKAPIAGRVKTRLMRQAGLSRAVGFYRTSTASVLARVGRDPRWQTLLAVAPDAAVASPAWPPELERVGQGAGDLGVRMQRIFDWMPPGPVIIVGSDIPGITADAIAHAFRLLGRHDAVFGPAGDGGYWLVGLRRRPSVARAFADVRWSSADTLSDSTANLAHLSIGMADLLNDVDSLPDLVAASLIGGRRVLPLQARTSGQGRRSHNQG